ncbi:MAG: M90 family metallopeptidase [Verrucomicrobiota bacterium]|nr:M90 family metallopeptidase [Verrucomicrobiota bacterium]
MMTTAILSILALLSIGGGIGWVRGKKQKRRAYLLAKPLPDEWQEIIGMDFIRYRGLPEELRRSLDGNIQVLMAEKYFEPCGGLEEVNLRMKLLICAQAGLLLIRLKQHGFYRKLKSILVYPGAFQDSGRRRFGLHEEEADSTMLGESWSTGSVILSWESILAGARNADDGMNVVIHEFAHQLDQVDGAANGVPILQQPSSYRRWAKVFLRNYDELVGEVESGEGRRSLIDPYGATNPAEFFAVASETFYEEARQLKMKQPDLYNELEGFYGVDPANWERV